MKTYAEDSILHYSVKIVIYIGQMSLYFRGPRLEPAKPIGKSGTDKAL